MSYRLRPRRDSTKCDTGMSPLTVMDVNRLASNGIPASALTSCHGRKRSPPSSEVPNKRLRSLLATPSPNSLTEPPMRSKRCSIVSSSRSRCLSYDASWTSPDPQPVQSAVVTPRFASPPAMTASSISMTSSWWSSIVEQSLTDLPTTSPVRLSKKSQKKGVGTKKTTTASSSTKNNSKVRTDELKMTAALPEGSIGKNAQDYYLLIRKSPNQKISMKAAANTLGIKVRRVYDVTNVLEGVGLIHRLAQTETMQLYTAKANTEAKASRSLRKEVDDLVDEEAELDDWILFLQEEQEEREAEKSMNFVPVSDLLKLPTAKGSSVVISMQPGTTLHRGEDSRFDRSFSIRAPPSGFAVSEGLPAFVLGGGRNTLTPSVRPLLLTCPPLLTACSSDFTEHALQDFTKQQHHHHQAYTSRNSCSSYQHSEFSQLSQPSDLDDIDENDLILMNDAASTLASMAVMSDKVEHSPLTATGTRRSHFWSTE